MGFEDIVGGAKDFLSSDQAEGVSDNVLDAAASKVDDLTGGKFSDQIDGVRDQVDAKIGDE